MDFNVGSFMITIIGYLLQLTNKLYEALNYQVDISFVGKVMSFFGASTDIPDTISLLGVLGIISAATLVGIIIYNIFKL